MVAETNQEVIEEFRANGGEVAAPYPDPPPMLLLHTIGAKTGKEHIVPMRCLVEGKAMYVFATAHGSPKHPSWYYNLKANPDFEIERGTETLRIHATELEGAERDRIYALQVARFPSYARWEQELPRRIPVIRLDPQGESR